MTGFASGSPFLTVPELAALLRVPVSWVYEHSRRVGPDTIPCYRAGKRLVFDREEVLAWFLETQRRQLLPVDRRRKRRAPGDGPGGQRARKPATTRGSANGPVPVALLLPRGELES
jgi:predicted DNA-binding transcriptional regulator AlpA